LGLRLFQLPDRRERRPLLERGLQLLPPLDQDGRRNLGGLGKPVEPSGSICFQGGLGFHSPAPSRKRGSSMTARLMIGTPCIGGQVSSLYARSVLNFQKACLGRDDARLELVAHWGDSLTTRARQGLVTQFLGHPTATHLLFINSNFGF